MTEEEAGRVIDAISKLIVAKVEYHFYSSTSYTVAGVSVARRELLDALRGKPRELDA